ncbi:MAG: TIGR03087 family PEP-CTERM/XrtA system glycosyltransferase [Paucibacter sp.]|nr:TIGR03087 family PEP-CTERM/XrtA system glycosyltransferase [Roseateles sp.]
MATLLYLVHRLPYPPNKGDKVRSWHLLRHLASRHRVHLATFVDDPDDWQHLPVLERHCASVKAVPLHPRRARLASLRGLLGGEALSLPYYRSNELAEWVDALAQRETLDGTVVFSSTMAQYAQRLADKPMLVDFVDVDSAKWSDYAPAHAWPLSWLYAREGRLLLDFERRVAAQARCSFFVTEKEVALFRERARLASGQGAAPDRIEALGNGVDAEFFAPDPHRASPFPAGQLPLVFTGAMDYWPNIDAVQWFVADMLPRLRERFPTLHFHIVGRSPSPAVQALAGPQVSVSGTVPDVRPYLEHAAAVVAPLRLARGIQNKVLEAMAMARPVVAARSCAAALHGAREGQELLAADDAGEWITAVEQLLADATAASRIGSAARAFVLHQHAWDAQLAGIDPYLESIA